MAIRTIECENCGAPRTTRMKNTKYCTACRLYKNLSYLKDRTHTCVVCEKEYAVTDRKPFMCRSCEAESGNHRTGHCGVCNTQDARLVWEDVACCVDCMDEPAKRGPIIKGLLQKIKRNREEYGKVAE